MSPNPFRTFHYHACAHAFSAHFTRPFEHQIDAQAASALPIVGGHGQARAENFQFREFLSFRKGATHVSGAPLEEEDKTRTHNTLVTASVEGLNLMDVVTADRIVARLYSKHHERQAEGTFNMIGSRFEGLRIADCDVEVKLDLGPFEKVPTYQAALDEFDKKGDFYKIANDPLGDGPVSRPGPNGVFLCSCVQDISIKGKCPGVEQVCRHGFRVSGFGTIYLGEVIVQHAQRTLTMIRFEIGSAVSGTGTTVQAFSNGRTYP